LTKAAIFWFTFANIVSFFRSLAILFLLEFFNFSKYHKVISWARIQARHHGISREMLQRFFEVWNTVEQMIVRMQT